jgi:hypothetical protein
VSPPAPEQQYWIIEPLLEAGLDLDQIRDLMFRVAFEGIVGEGDTALTALVGDQPPAVRAAWRRAVGRMITGERAAEWA